MRGVRSLIVLLVIAITLGWFAYRESLKGPVDDSPKHDKVFTVEADKIDELQIKSEAGERTTLLDDDDKFCPEIQRVAARYEQLRSGNASAERRT